MPTVSYKLGRDCVATLPGVVNGNIKSVTINASANQLDVTTFKATPLTQYEYQTGLVDVTIDVECTETTATVGSEGPCDVANIDSDLLAVVLDVKEQATPQGVVQYTVSYGLKDPAA